MQDPLVKNALLAALVLCGLGLLWRVAAWLRTPVGPEARGLPLHRRLWAATGGALGTLTGPRLPGVLKALLLDVVLQRRLWADSKARWLGHMAILAGFTALLVLHALAPLTTAKWFQGYVSTKDPWLALRNVFGVLVVAGVAVLVLARRRGAAAQPRARRPAEGIFLALLAVVLASGFLLEAQKIASPKAFDRMAKEYDVAEDAPERAPLRAAWAADYGVAFPDLRGPPDPDLLEEGRSLNKDYCADCHASPRTAFVSWPLSRALAPAATALDDANADRALWWIHVAACLLGLVVLPFTRFFHALADPVSLLAAGAAARAPLSPAGRANRRALAFDACTGCRLCDDRCSVAPVARALDNPDLLPSHKVLSTARTAARPGRLEADPARARRLAEGAFGCTDCGRCTERCPVGLDLADLWDAGRGDLAAAGHPAPGRWVRERPALDWADALEARPDARAPAGPLSSRREAYQACVQCQTCTNVCPVVAHGGTGDDPVDLTPQKVMNLLRLGMADLALGSRMVWSCATCYQCQEQCPEGIRVTDVMLELRNQAYRRLGDAREGRRAP